ncbi:hypothetical protein QP028_07640 [Corynebacterium suedekumii]|nr:hypothetical protein QP028_07640 [Corynebacterium suedekumii]
MRFAPVTPKSFEFLYSALNRNLRDSLSYAQTFSGWLCEYLDSNPDQNPDEEDVRELLQIWLCEESDAAYQDAKSVQRRVWQFFDALAQVGGTARSADYEDFGFSTQQQFGSSVTSLEHAKLVAREVDPDDGSRKLVTMTPTGWLVYFHRNRYELPSSSVTEGDI